MKKKKFSDKQLKDLIKEHESKIVANKLRCKLYYEELTQHRLLPTLLSTVLASLVGYLTTAYLIRKQ